MIYFRHQFFILNRMAIFCSGGLKRVDQAHKSVELGCRGQVPMEKKISLPTPCFSFSFLEFPFIS
jgi:hypothetical protein